MAHQVTFNVPDYPVGKSDIEFDIRKDGVMFGTLKVSKGGIVWRPRDNQYGYILNWDKISNITEREGRRERY